MTKLSKGSIIGKKKPPTKTIEVKAYGGATLEIRALSILELTKMLLKLKKEGFNLEDFKKMSEREPDFSVLPMMSDLCNEACKYGIIDKEIRDVVDDFAFGATFEVGGAILKLTMESMGGVEPLTNLLK